LPGTGPQHSPGSTTGAAAGTTLPESGATASCMGAWNTSPRKTRRYKFRTSGGIAAFPENCYEIVNAENGHAGMLHWPRSPGCRQAITRLHPTRATNWSAPILRDTIVNEFGQLQSELARSRAPVPQCSTCGIGMLWF